MSHCLSVGKKNMSFYGLQENHGLVTLQVYRKFPNGRRGKLANLIQISSWVFTENGSVMELDSAVTVACAWL